MGDTIDLTGNGGVVKTIVRHAKANADAPTDSLPLVDAWKRICDPDLGTFLQDNEGVGGCKNHLHARICYGSAGSPPDATLVFEVELVACKPRKGLRIEELKRQREATVALKEEEKKKERRSQSCRGCSHSSQEGPGKREGQSKITLGFGITIALNLVIKAS